MFARRALTSCLAAAALLTAAWVSCAAGEMTVAEMACCTDGNHQCGMHGSVAECCKTDPQAQLVAAANPSYVVPAPVLASDRTATPEASAVRPEPWSAVRHFERRIRNAPHQPTYLLVSAFLI